MVNIFNIRLKFYFLMNFINSKVITKSSSPYSRVKVPKVSVFPFVYRM